MNAMTGEQAMISNRAILVRLCLVALSSLGMLLLLGSPRGLISETDHVAVAMVLDWALALLVLAFVTCSERLSLRSIGLTMPACPVLRAALLCWLIGSLTFLLTTPLVNALGLSATTGSLVRLARIPVEVRVALVVTAGICEELVFRGYLIERLALLTGNLRLAAMLAWAVFTLLHLPRWGSGGTLQIGAWALVISILYLRTRSLPACMLMHILNDSFAFIILPLLVPLR